MHSVIYLSVSVVIAAVIGGATNHLAIKMLFRPRAPIYVGKRKLPFTPGLIPKRKDEIGRSLGQVVGEYLVTSHGLQRMLGKPEIRTALEARGQAWLRGLADDDSTVGERLAAAIGEERAEAARQAFAERAQAAAEAGADWLWNESGWLDRPVGTLLPDWERRKEEWIDRGAELLLAAIGRELDSPGGERLLLAMIGQFVNRSGGFFGALAGIFMDEQKMAGKVKEALRAGLASPAARQAMHKLLADLAAKLEERTPDELLRQVLQEEPLSWAKRAMRESRLVAGGMERLWNMRIAALYERYGKTLERALPRAIGMALDLVGSRMDRIVEAVRLPELVEEQVAEFPVEQLERLLLSVSGREFRAITWLGALLGAIIGLFQALLLLGIS